MAWILGTDVPPALQTLWNALTSPGKNTQGADGALRLKKGKKKPKKPPKADLDLRAFRSVAEIVWTLRGGELGNAEADQFVFNLVRDMALGVLDGRYFRQCPVVSAETLETYPTNVPDPSPPAYGYRTPLFMPSDVTYPDGTPTAEAPTFHGGKVGTYFHDILLRWRKILFSTYWIDEPDAEKRLLLLWDTTITIQTTARGSRPMVSLNILGVIAKAGAAALTSTAAPILKKTTLYWRFKVPPSAAPFYNSYQVRKVSKPFARIAKKQGAGAGIGVVVNASNRPMMGRGFNNNNDVVTTFNGDPELWEIKPPCVSWSFAQGNAWTWKESPAKIWTVTIYYQNSLITAAHALNLSIGLRVSDGVTTTTFVITETIPGDWTWAFDYAGGDGDGALPRATTAQVVDASCGGNKAILSLSRPFLHFLKGSRGFLLLELTSTTSATVSVIADTAACNDSTITMEQHNYGTAGMQTDTYYTEPKTIHCWFNDADQVEQVRVHDFAFIDFTTAAGYSETVLSIDTIPLSTVRSNYDGASIYTGSLDGYDDAGRLKLNLFNLSYMNRAKTLSMVFPIWNTRFLWAYVTDFYSASAPLTDETGHPGGQCSIQPLIYSNKSVGFVIDVYHFIMPSPPDVKPHGLPPTYVLSDRYFGKIVHPGYVDSTIIHTPI